MNGLKVFESSEFGKVRSVMIDGAPWLVGKDVAEALGYVDTINALKQHVEDEDEVMGSQNTTPYIKGHSRHTMKKHGGKKSR